TIRTSLDSRSIKDKSISAETVLRHDCLDSITSTSTVALSTSTICSLLAGESTACKAVWIVDDFTESPT
ncbi:MAG: hypothetical protein NTV29_02515, partial [Planctomycetota bacterium]|nr:hypothetical protein [Planctomycetota bacterium]